MTNDKPPLEPNALPEPVTGVARAGQGTGTALDDTQVYDVAELAADPAAAEASQPAPMTPPPLEPAPAVPPVPRIDPRPARRAGPRAGTSSGPRPRVSAPVAGLVGFALAAGLAILVGASLGGMTVPGGAADHGASPEGTATGAPAETEANDDDGGDDGKGKGCGKGRDNDNDRGDCDED